MTAKEYLQQGYKLNQLIQSKRDIIDQLITQATSISAIEYSKDRVSGGSASSDASYVDTIIEAHELETLVVEKYKELKTLQLEMFNAIQKVQDISERLVLEYRYILCKSWKDISNEFNYSEMQVHRLHSKALKNFVVPV